jgi:hypothetical protein
MSYINEGTQYATYYKYPENYFFIIMMMMMMINKCGHTYTAPSLINHCSLSFDWEINYL